MEFQVKIETNRLILKGITPQIINEILRNFSPKEAQTYFNIDEAGYQQLKIMAENGMETHRITVFYFLVIEKSKMQVIGECGFHTLNKTHSRAELFYLLKDDLDKKKGYMSEVLYYVLDYGFCKLNLHRVEALVGAENIASRKLLQKFDFKYEGIMREDYKINGKNEDSYCYSLLKQEWDEQNNNREEKA